MGSSTTYYDSQSGLNIAFTNETNVHAFVHSALLPATVSGLASITLPDVGHFALASPAETPIFIPTSTKAELESALAVGAHCSVVLNCSSARGLWDDVLAICASGRAAGMQVKATIQGALDVDPSKLVLAAELLADSGVELLMLEVSSDFDEDDMAEAFEALVGADVAGLPMKQRIGVCIVPESPDSELIDVVDFAASNLGIKHIATDFDGTFAPKPEQIHQVLMKTGLLHSFKLA
jgi:hypothetical protein